MAQTAAAESTTQAGEHPIPKHPPVAHIAIGAYVTAGVCDTISVFGFAGDDGSYFNHAAWYALIVGVAAMAVAVITGLIDRVQNTRPGGQGRRMVNIHALFMLALGPLSMINIVTRAMGSSFSESHTPIGNYVLTVAILILMVIGGRIGGVVVYRLGVGTPNARRGSSVAASASASSVPSK